MVTIFNIILRWGVSTYTYRDVIKVREKKLTESLLYAITGRELANSTKHKNIGQD